MYSCNFSKLLSVVCRVLTFCWEVISGVAMAGRQNIKNAHEQAIITAYVNWFNLNNNCSYKVIERPEPPDAILYDSKTQHWTWIEHTDVPFCNDYMHTKYSWATPGEKEYKPKGPYVNFDLQHAHKFFHIVHNKLSKPAYQKIALKYGPGTLVVILHSPWLSDETLEMINIIAKEKQMKNTTRYFKTIIIGDTSKEPYGFKEWIIPAC